MNDELIPCDDELNRLKEFLAELMKPTKRFLEMNVRVREANRQWWIDAIKGGPFPKGEL